MKIDPSKKYTTRDGRPVTHLHRVPDGFKTKYPWRGIIYQEEVRWTDSGTFIEGSTRSHDLVEVREPLEIELVVTGNGKWFATLLNTDHWDKVNPNNAPHRTAKFREVMP